ncbi:MAG: L-seryl-tRNA(Sec) selenium transferase, partial [Deltaproteobacteria bacterium]|nr:L-seryl-tRNA(Sec) selenium transferase [Deltaproteobacteria bacterium]
MSEAATLLSRLPSVERVLSSPAAARLLGAFSRDATAEAVRGVLEELRRRIRCDGVVGADELGVEQVVSQAGARLAALWAPKLRRVINATGVVLHTNLGRAALASSAIDAVVAAASGACNLEYDLARAGRGD